MKGVIRILYLVAVLSGAQAAGPLKAVTSERELSDLLQPYNLHPQPELVESALRYADSTGLFDRPAAGVPLMMSFSCIFAQYDDNRKAGWRRVIDELGEPARSLLFRAMDAPPMHCSMQRPSRPPGTT